MLTSRYGCLDIVQKLLEHSVDVNSQEEDLWTALHLASDAGNVEVARLSIKWAANPRFPRLNRRNATSQKWGMSISLRSVVRDQRLGNATV